MKENAAKNLREADNKMYKPKSPLKKAGFCYNKKNHVILNLFQDLPIIRMRC